MNEVMMKDNIKIESMIYEIRGQQVMLDRDLAKLYKVETKVFMQAVKRNIERFPKNFMFQLTEEEFFNWRSQFVTSKNDKMGLRRPPYAFTEQGVAMLSGILRSKIAINTSILIIETFVAMRKYISTNLIEQKYINDLVLKDHDRIELLENSFEIINQEKEVNEIYFDGKIYDAYSKIIDIFNESKNELIIIDRYADKTILDMIKNIKCKVVIITSIKSKLTELDIKKYNSTYNNLTIIYDETYHDRYFIIDGNKIYHSGNSVNHIGYRKSSINVLEDKNVKNSIINDIKNIISNK